jgi:hypothetical protein
VAIDLCGVWNLTAWRRIADDGTITYPLGEDARGQLVYTETGRMAVQMTGESRPLLETSDPLGGDTRQRADAYSTCLAYVGSYEVRGDTVVHWIDVSLFPNWSGAEQIRPFSYSHDELVLRTPPTASGTGVIINEISWVRDTR